MTSKTCGTAARILAGGLVIAALAAPGAMAQEATPLGTHNYWTAWRSTDANGVICYISSQPQTTAPTNVNRSPIHFLVIHRRGLGTSNEVQTLVGYPLDASTTPSVSVDGRSFNMVVEGSAAWLASTSDEGPFVDAMKGGSQMVVRGRSQRGTDTTDTYSLMGVTAAMNQIDTECT